MKYTFFNCIFLLPSFNAFSKVAAYLEIERYKKFITYAIILTITSLAMACAMIVWKASLIVILLQRTRILHFNKSVQITPRLMEKVRL